MPEIQHEVTANNSEFCFALLRKGTELSSARAKALPGGLSPHRDGLQAAAENYAVNIMKRCAYEY